MSSIPEGVWLPLVTPFRAAPSGQGDRVDTEALARLARHAAGHGIAGFVAGATSGEGALLRDGEIEQIVATLRAVVPGRPLVLGVSQPATDAAAAQARRLAALGPDGLLVTPPPYLRPSQAGIQRHLEAVTEAADRPVLVYDIPYRTGVTVEIETLQALARDPRVVGIKACGCSDDRMLRLVHETPLRVFAGDDHQNFVALCLGAAGVIAASAHVLPHLHVRMRELVLAGRLAEARRIAVALQPLVGALFAEPNPAPVKAVLAQQGWCSAQVRLPFLPASAALTERLRQLTHALDGDPTTGTVFAGSPDTAA